MTELDQIVAGIVWGFQGWAEVFDEYEDINGLPGHAMARSLRHIADMFVRHYVGIFPRRLTGETEP